jgi:hypothetical protein
LNFSFLKLLILQIAILEFAIKCQESQRKVKDNIQKGIFSEREVLENSLSFEFPENSLKRLYRRLRITHQIACKVADMGSEKKEEVKKEEEENVRECGVSRVYTHWDLFRAVEPIVAMYYEKILTRFFGDPIAAFHYVISSLFFLFCVSFCTVISFPELIPFIQIAQAKTSLLDESHFIETVLSPTCPIPKWQSDGTFGTQSLREALEDYCDEKIENTTKSRENRSGEKDSLMIAVQSFLKDILWNQLTHNDQVLCTSNSCSCVRVIERLNF